MTVEKFVGSGVLLTAHKRKEREVVVCPRCRLVRGKSATVTISGKSKATIQQTGGRGGGEERSESVTDGNLSVSTAASPSSKETGAGAPASR